MISKEDFKGFLALIAGIALFQGITHLQNIKSWMENNPLIIIGLALLLFFQRDKISQKIGGKLK